MNRNQHRAPSSGSISKNPSGTYRAQLTIPSETGGKPRRETRSFKTKREADEWLRRGVSEVNSGLTAENQKITIAEYCKRWLAAKSISVRSSTLDDYQRICRLYIVPGLGEKPLRNIKTADVNTFYAGLSGRDTGTQTIDYVHRVLRGVFFGAMREGIVSANPCIYASRPKVRKKRNVDVMSEKEATTFLAYGDATPYSVLLRTALVTGMRLGELLGLTWRDIDFENGLISVNKQIPTRHVKGVPRVASKTKTESGNRTLPIGRSLLKDLEDHRTSLQRQIILMGKSWKNQDLVFPSSIGTPLQPGYPEKTCKEIFANIGLGNDFTFHNLRHTAASIMLKNGMSLVEASRYLGHASPSITAEIYAHVMPGGLEKATVIFDGLISSKGGGE